MHNKIEDLIKSESSIVYRSISGMDIMLMRSIILGDFATIKHELSMINNKTENENMEQIERISRIICDECIKLKTIQEVASFYQDTIIGRTDWLIKALKDAINYINIKYEKHEKNV
jgi:hypothetical protein